MWQWLRNRRCCGQKFRREVPIPPYTADFCCVELQFIVEIDGQHHDTDEGRERDLVRDRFLADLGYQVLRVPGYEVLRAPEAVLARIEEAVRKRIEERSCRASPSPPERGEGSERKSDSEFELTLWQIRPYPKS